MASRLPGRGVEEQRMKATKAGERAWEAMQGEGGRYPPSPAFRKEANAQPDIYNRKLEDFWTKEANERISWFEPWKQLLEGKPPYAKWFIGGKLNVCFNCVDRHVEKGQGGKVADFWEGEPENDRRPITLSDLQKEVVRVANGLKKLGVTKRRHVAIYTGMRPLLPLAH